MKKLLKYISPLAPDDSGACSVLYELGGIVVICDAGGCTGNICGFDEPRWHEKKSAVFSAGLRDMDAILGRDDRLIDKLARACEQLRPMQPQFTAIIGTPVPAVIATDLHAVKRMAEKQTGLPCIAVETNGTEYYDRGAEKTYCALFEAFAAERFPTQKGKIGILGATPLDTGCTHACDVTAGTDAAGAVCFGMDSTLDEIRRASECESLLVIAPSGLKAAKLLRTRFGIPYEIGAPRIPEDVIAQAMQHDGEPMLIVHQQFAANALRHKLRHPETADCATWFLFDNAYAQSGDFPIRGEEDLQKAAKQYRVIAADRDLQRLLPDYHGTWIDFPHYAVSARLINTNQ